MPSPIAITAPSTTVVLAENRLGEMPFTVTNTTDQPRRGRASVVALDGAPPAWFSLASKAELDLPPGSTAQVVVRVEPPLGVPAGTHLFRRHHTTLVGAAVGELAVAVDLAYRFGDAEDLADPRGH
ncbi:MAG: hypothetical protein ACRD0A_15785 [Acidimicrobiales bacterium]